jgi:hypothetical protein
MWDWVKDQEAKMDFEHDLSVCQPISLQVTPQQFAIVFQLVDQTAAGPVASKKQVRLGLTHNDAVQLLALLETARQRLGLQRAEGQVLQQFVPPKKDQN